MRSSISLASPEDRRRALRHRAARTIRLLLDGAHVPSRVRARFSGAMDDRVRSVKRRLTHYGHGLEDARDAAAYRIKHAPFTSVALTAGGGLLVGTVVAWTVRRRH
jgi:hypothetical protein